MKTKKKLVMIGNGMAGMKAIEEILNCDPDLFDITIFGKEKYPNYNRVLLSTVLAGKMSIDDITLNDKDWYKERNITLHLGKKVTDIHRGWRKVVAEDGTEAEYDSLIIATGSTPFIIPIPGADKEGVITFRSIDDCNRMIDASKDYKKAAVIGGGLLGLEAAKGLMNLGMDVTVVHDQSTLMNMQLDETAGAMLKENLEGQGMNFRLKTLTREIVGDDRVTGLLLDDGSTIECDLVVMAVGIRPNKSLAERSRLYCNRGIVVNDYMQTLTDPAVFAVGECIEHRKKTYGLIPPLFEQARILAYHITGQGFRSYPGSVVSTRLKVSGVDVFSAGDFLGDESSEVIEYIDRSGGSYKKLLLKDNRIIGTVLFGDTTDCPRFFQMMQDEVDISSQRSTLLLGSTIINSVSEMTSDTIVCGCNGVTKGHIVDAITKHGLTTPKEVAAHTKASASCGGCASLVQQILSSLIGSTFTTATALQPICSCTDYTHEEIKDTIVKNHLTDVHEAMRFMEFGGEGCHVCRPAINYYIQTFWPEEGRDDRFSRVVNERMHANIQKDGTFSVVPRVYGGLSNAEDLMRIAEVAKKYDVPAVKVTGGQRIGLFGVKKEDLVSVWKDLDMDSGYAYGKALRTVKTCVGSTWCRFGTGDSMALGVRLEKTFERMWTPAKFKMAVSGCPRNCAEATIKDLGVVIIEGAWKIYCGGNGGVKVRAADLLATVKTEGELLEIVKAFVQYYRGNAKFGERTATWIERVGLDKVTDIVINDLQERSKLAAQYDNYIKTLRDDPWKVRIDAAEKQDDKELLSDYIPIGVCERTVN